MIGNFSEYETMPLYCEEVLTYMDKLTSCDDLWNCGNNNKYLNIYKKPIKPIYIGTSNKEELK